MSSIQQSQDGLRAIREHGVWSLQIPQSSGEWVQQLQYGFDQGEHRFYVVLNTAVAISDIDKGRIKFTYDQLIRQLMERLGGDEPYTVEIVSQPVDLQDLLRRRQATKACPSKGSKNGKKKKSKKDKLDAKGATAISMRRMGNKIREAFHSARLYELPYLDQKTSDAVKQILACLKIQYDPDGIRAEIQDYNKRVDIVQMQLEKGVAEAATELAGLENKFDTIIAKDKQFVEAYKTSALQKSDPADSQTIYDLFQFAKERIEQHSVYTKQKAAKQAKQAKQQAAQAPQAKPAAEQSPEKPETKLENKRSTASGLGSRRSTSCGCNGKLKSGAKSGCSCALSDLD